MAETTLRERAQMAYDARPEATTPGACCLWPRPTTITPAMRRALRTFVPAGRAREYGGISDGIRWVDSDRPTYRLLVAAGLVEIIGEGRSSYRRGGGCAPQWRLRITERGRAALAEREDTP